MTRTDDARRGFTLVLALAVLWAVTPGLGGMAELGRARTLTLSEQAAPTDPANNDGFVSLQLGPSASEIAVHFPDGICSGGTGDGASCRDDGDCGGGTCTPKSDWTLGGILDDLALKAGVTHPAGSEELDLGGEDVFVFRNEDSAFGYVSGTRGSPGFFGVQQVSQSAGGGTVQIQVELETATSRVVSVPLMSGMSATTVNGEIVSALNANGFDVRPTGSGVIQIRRDLLDPGAAITKISWSDDDTGITKIGITTNAGKVKPIPTLSGWALLLLILVLSASALRALHRRSRATG